MIQMFCDGVLLYDPRSADYIVAEPKCELEVNKTGNLTFRIAPTHPLYGQIQRLKSEIAVYQDNERLGAFRVLNVEQDFNNIKTVTCEGELAYLLDSVQRAAEYHDVIAFISNQALKITYAEIRYKLSLGSVERGWFDFIPRATGNLSIIWRDAT